MEQTKEVEKGDYNDESQRLTTKPYMMIFGFSLLVSIFGGFLLVWWLHKYHSKNKQLWMVPFSLIFFLTPLIIWFFLFISHLFISKSDEKLEDASMSQLTLIHPKRWCLAYMLFLCMLLEIAQIIELEYCL